MFVEVVGTAGARGEERGVYYTITNYGKVPAIMRSIAVALTYNAQGNMSATLPVSNEDYAILAPGKKLQIRDSTDAWITAELDRDDIPAGERPFHGSNATLLSLQGIIEYEDPADTLYEDQFCLRATWGARSFKIDDRDANHNKSTPRRKKRNGSA